jgi:hypothetical protein
MAHLFISYHRHDEDKYRSRTQLIELLKGRHACYFDGDMPGGVEWQKRLRADIERSDAVMFIATQASIKSDWCLAELFYAATQHVPIIPIWMGQNRKPVLPEYLGWLLQCVNLNDPTINIYDMLETSISDAIAPNRVVGLSHFLGLSHTRREIIICLSCVPLFASETTLRPVNSIEVEAATDISNQIIENILIDHLEQNLTQLRRLLQGSTIVPMERPRFRSIIAPTEAISAIPPEWNRRTLIVLGTGHYNSVANWFEQRDDCPYQFDWTAVETLLIDKSSQQVMCHPDQEQFPDSGVVHVFDRETLGQVVIMCAGNSARSTKAGVLWLIDNWKLMTEKHTAYLAVARSPTDPDNKDNGEFHSPVDEIVCLNLS